MKKLKRFSKHSYLGIAYILFLFGFLVAGSHLTVNYEFLSPLASEPVKASEIQNLQVSYKIEEHNYIKLKVSHYWPELGGTNCGNFVNGVCISKMANGQRWQDWVGEAIACPKELAFGTKIKIGDRVWTCRDRGGKIDKLDEVFWVDQLTPYSLYKYGEEVVGELL